MLLNKNKKEREAEIPSSSMADIAFLLLVFFLLTTTIDMAKGLDITLPDDTSEIKLPKENITNILIDATGQVLMSNEPTEIHEIGSKVKDAIAENRNMVFSLKTVRDSRYDDFIAVFDQLKIGGAKKISIADPDEG